MHAIFFSHSILLMRGKMAVKVAGVSRLSKKFVLYVFLSILLKDLIASRCSNTTFWAFNSSTNLFVAKEFRIFSEPFRTLETLLSHFGSYRAQNWRQLNEMCYWFGPFCCVTLQQIPVLPSWLGTSKLQLLSTGSSFKMPWKRLWKQSSAQFVFYSGTVWSCRDWNKSGPNHTTLFLLTWGKSQRGFKYLHLCLLQLTCYCAFWNLALFRYWWQWKRYWRLWSF